MSNHRWKNNVCVHCGTIRERRDFKRWQRVESVLRNGIWEDKHYYTYGTAWYYGDQFKFERPSCALLEHIKIKRYINE